MKIKYNNIRILTHPSSLKFSREFIMHFAAALPFAHEVYLHAAGTTLIFHCGAHSVVSIPLNLVDVSIPYIL